MATIPSTPKLKTQANIMSSITESDLDSFLQRSIDIQETQEWIRQYQTDQQRLQQQVQQEFLRDQVREQERTDALLQQRFAALATSIANRDLVVYKGPEWCLNSLCNQLSHLRITPQVRWGTIQYIEPAEVVLDSESSTEADE